MKETLLGSKLKFAKQTESVKSKLELKAQILELNLKEKQENSWRNQNSTLETFIKMLMIPASIAVLIWGMDIIWNKNASQIGLMIGGCNPEPSTYSQTFIPEPFPNIEDAKYIDELIWRDDRIEQLLTVLHNRDLDRDAIRKLCGN